MLCSARCLSALLCRNPCCAHCCSALLTAPLLCSGVQGLDLPDLFGDAAALDGEDAAALAAVVEVLSGGLGSGSGQQLRKARVLVR